MRSKIVSPGVNCPAVKTAGHLKIVCLFSVSFPLVGNPSICSGSQERFWTSLPAYGGAEGDQGQNDRNMELRQRPQGVIFINKLLCLLILLFFLVSSCAGVSPRSDTADPFDLGLSLFNQGNYKEAIPFFQKSIEADSDRAKAYLYLGRSYLNLSMWLKAVPPLRTAVSLSTGEMKQEAVNVFLDALMSAALFEFEKGDFDSAISRLKEVLDLKPEFIKARDELIKMLFSFSDKLMSKGLIEEAISKYREILKLAPEMLRAQEELIDLLFKFAEKLLSEGQLEDAIKQYGEIIEVAPDDLKAYLGLARAFFESGDYVKAMEAVKDALQKDPANSDALSLFRKLLTR